MKNGRIRRGSGGQGNLMITINTSGNGILLKSLERSRLDAVTELYNCSRDIWYATGITDSISCMELDSRLFSDDNGNNEFMAGIYVRNTSLPTSDSSLQLIGLISGFIQNKTIWIKVIAILPQYRRKGIGSRAARLLMQYFKAGYGAAEVFLSVIKENGTGMLFWLEQGFSESFRFSKKLFDMQAPYEVIIMQKRL